MSGAGACAASSTFKTEHDATVRPGESMTVGKHEVRLEQVWGREEPRRSERLGDELAHREEPARVLARIEDANDPRMRE